jgi:hypothetical protein
MADKEMNAGDVRARARRHLRELIEALDSRIPHIEGAGETAITRDAAMLREKALKRLADLESDD